MTEIEFVLYVSDQQKSKSFYQQLLNIRPSLDVPGMTEFKLKEGVKLGLMPENGIAKILQDNTVHPSEGQGIPRCEIYLVVDNAQELIDKGIQQGGKEISKLSARDWGDKVGYISDLDGHIIAFAERA